MKQKTPAASNSLSDTAALQAHDSAREALAARAEAAERALHESRSFAHALMANASDAIVVANVDTGLLVDCNSQAEQLLGLSHAEIIGRRPADLHPPEQAQQVESLFGNTAQAGHGKSINLQVVRSDGSMRDVEVTIFLQCEQGTPLAHGIFRDVTEKQKARDHVALLSEAMSRSLTAFAIAGEDERIVHVNANYLKMWGYDNEAEVIGTSPVSHCVDPDMPNRIIAALRHDGHGRFEFQARRKDGSIFDVLMDAFVWRDVAGKAYFVGLLLDLSREKDALVRWRASEARYRHFVENFQGIAFQIRYQDNEPIFMHGQVEAITGYTAEDYVSKRLIWGDIVHPEDLPAYQRIKAQLQSARVHVSELEYRIINKAGQVRWIRDVGEITFCASGEPEFIQGTAYDITKRKQAELELAERQRELSTLMSNLPGMAYRCANDEHWTMVFVSDGVRDVTGYASEDVVQNRRISYERLIHADDSDEVRRLVSRALARHEPFELSYRIHDALGQTRWIWERGQGVFDAAGRLKFLEGFVWDVTQHHQAEVERDKLEAQLHQMQKMEAIGKLAGGVAHDFNNMLTAVFGNVELALFELKKAEPRLPRVIDGLNQIEKGAHRAAALTRQLLTFSRRQVIRPEVVDLNVTLRDLEKMLKRLISEAITIECVYASDLQCVKVDPGQFEQAVINLVLNARDAMPDGGRLRIDTRNVSLDEAYVSAHPDAAVGAFVQISVSDTGCGMDAETRECLFEPFFTTKPVGQGTGLGLANVYGIIKQSGGSVAVDSELGLGSTFKLLLPALPDSVPTQTSKQIDRQAPTGAETIVVCEDDAAVRELTSLLLKDAGYQVLLAATASEALQIVADHRGTIDLLVTDVIMPEMNGRKLADAVIAEHPEIKTLFVSGYSADVIAYHGVLSGDVALLEKPYSRRQLLLAVREVLDAAKSD